MKHITTDTFKIEEPTAVTIGNFDGLHLGHRKLIGELKSRAQADGLSSVVFSFFPHPLTVLRCEPNVQMIVSPEEKAYLLEQMGVDYFIEYPFTKDFADITAEDFVRNVLIEQLNCKLLLVGEGYRFGKNQLGSAETVKKIGGEYGLQVIIVPHIEHDGIKISSTVIRKLIADRQFSLAEKYLSQPYFVGGKVMRGKRVGRTIGFPTVNLLPFANKLLPPDGVYLTRTKCGQTTYNSITNIGNNPTVNGRHKTVETYLFGYTGSLYGEIVWVEFFNWLRDVVKFDSLSGLQQQISKDIEAAKVYFGIS